ncbi:isoaspartyl peptidase/L-asparaginase [Leptolyngbyaceae cyanobacterium CCMR0082]|uniref:Isoaspartyl peptidase/L-asparaginase n=2 Tax=Adonisia turfae TaxID=2950184 RepID=A0A6M0SD80_9CYAN|nr:isoaspartyl peptidase/L-asparaginase family protein [Adonisia turfae]EKV00803.1 asparaginase [Leptolyngbya sp. PCC 7375]MDV3352781.1 isoaspartyl peptidase/L-asparaginase family protein [Leptothoe sp. LEGE 181152]NEZ56282.1 isoaspartyl peptidase/L-asparaginase [Adonisia turfae CCMR0081]NEZ65931.1 isoaspartyl peptidase/L-asparaginase [Adonisia turfae CCMR0082]
MPDQFSLIIHGGAGALEQIKREGNETEFMESIRSILESGRSILTAGGSALDAVEHCAAQLEDDPLYNAGRGSVLNEYGEVEMDAAIMDGKTFQAGAVAGITSIKNPTALARQVLEKSEHVMLIGKGAREFAKFCGLPRMANDYFVIETRVRQWREAQKVGGMMLDHEAATPSQKLGTVGAVARDSAGNLAAATSTGGIVNKRWGRVGDSPIVGAGVFADNDTCAVSATGYGEQFQRTVLCKMIADFVYFQKLDAQAAATAGIDYLVKKVQGLGGVIVIDQAGNCAVGHSTSGMIYGWIEHGGEALCKLA